MQSLRLKAQNFVTLAMHAVNFCKINAILNAKLCKIQPKFKGKPFKSTISLTQKKLRSTH